MIRSFRFARSIVRINATHLQVGRQFHLTRPVQLINPLLPFDVLEELQNDDSEKSNEKLKKDKKKLIKKNKNLETEFEKEKFPTSNVSLPLDKASSDAHNLELKKSENAASDKLITKEGNDYSASNGGNNNKPPNRPEEEQTEEDGEPEEKNKSKFQQSLEKFGRFLFKCLETIGITFSSIAILGFAGLLYHKFYNVHVISKIDQAFEKGDPAYQLSAHKRTNKHSEENNDGVDLSQYWVERPQQKLLDDIVSGKIVGRYFLVIGEKGTGKTSLLLESMKKTDGYNVAIFDAHTDPEIFRLRLGKALNFTYSEDYIGSLFSIRGPRDTTALLDIERAFSKLEELAINRVARTNRPLVMIINNAHLIKENEEGDKLIELLQQKAESLSGSGLLTMIFNSDDYWVYEKLKKLGTRLELINVRDFNRKETISALKFTREKHFPSSKFPGLKLNDDLCHKIYDLIGGRPQHISQVARHMDILKACHEIIDREKTWFLNQCGLLGMDMDDDVMESGKFAISAMLLMREFIEMDRKRLNTLISQDLPDPKDEFKDHHLPELPLWRSRQIMTRADYIQQYDNLNIFTIDSDSRVRADSIPMMRAFHEVASHPHFDDLLKETIQRVADIESLGRTREIVAKDLNLGSQYQISTQDSGYQIELNKSKKQIEIHGDDTEDDDGDDNDEELLMEDINSNGHKKWWKKRMQGFNQSYLPPRFTDQNDTDLNRNNK